MMKQAIPSKSNLKDPQHKNFISLKKIPELHLGVHTNFSYYVLRDVNKIKRK